MMLRRRGDHPEGWPRVRDTESDGRGHPATALSLWWIAMGGETPHRLLGDNQRCGDVQLAIYQQPQSGQVGEPKQIVPPDSLVLLVDALGLKGLSCDCVLLTIHDPLDGDGAAPNVDRHSGGAAHVFEIEPDPLFIHIEPNPHGHLVPQYVEPLRVDRLTNGQPCDEITHNPLHPHNLLCCVKVQLPLLQAQLSHNLLQFGVPRLHSAQALHHLVLERLQFVADRQQCLVTELDMLHPIIRQVLQQVGPLWPLRAALGRIRTIHERRGAFGRLVVRQLLAQEPRTAVTSHFGRRTRLCDVVLNITGEHLLPAMLTILQPLGTDFVVLLQHPPWN
mmetsp:Transcript_43512/g.78206  ORF Transcript_43512/g.78206 Transcript_43512/m.78206 type:complete len:334 (+) Transcript_43512:708-1709(+)